MRRPLAALGAAATAAALCLAPSAGGTDQPAPLPPVEYVDVAAEAGVDFRHVTGASGRRYFPETMGSGVGFVDFDGDQDLDIYFVNGAPFPGYTGPPNPVNALFRNDGGRFVEAAARAGVDDPGHGMGCAFADYDNDGDADLYLTNYGANVMYRNEGDGRYREVPGQAGAADTAWSTGSTFFDYDNDGDLDLYVANYVRYDLAYVEGDLEAYLPASRSAPEEGIEAYPHPRNFAGAEDHLFRNEGGGRFRTVTRLAGLVDTSAAAGRGLGVVATDYDSDGWSDLYVANDAVPNFLYHNEGGGRFAEVGGVAGVAYGEDGQEEAGMGVDAADYDNDGRPDLVVTNFENEPNSLYRNRGAGFFPHASFPAGVGLASLRWLSFGVAFVDYDNDGYQDLFAANGHVLDNASAFHKSSSYGQPNQLLRNLGPDAAGRYRFRDVSPRAGEALTRARVSRGCAVGDYDDDGDTDIVVSNSGQPAALLRNEGGDSRHWLTIAARGRAGNRDAIGARIEVWAGDLYQVKEVRGSFSYLSQRDLRVSFGLGSRTRVDSLRIHWPGGGVERLADLQLDRFVTLVEGRVGHPDPAPGP
ncbi:MAG: CRTAC1 family protein [Gemmatimonadaceae bacterium]|nr:CRTAC1 family protein [Gemmatimonadaceae bacterium]